MSDLFTWRRALAVVFIVVVVLITTLGEHRQAQREEATEVAEFAVINTSDLLGDGWQLRDSNFSHSYSSLPLTPDCQVLRDFEKKARKSYLPLGGTGRRFAQSRGDDTAFVTEEVSVFKSAGNFQDFIDASVALIQRDEFQTCFGYEFGLQLSGPPNSFEVVAVHPKAVRDSLVYSYGWAATATEGALSKAMHFEAYGLRRGLVFAVISITSNNGQVSDDFATHLIEAADDRLLAASKR